ncbi:DJ-1/PfpI family protein [Ferrimonas aestuarii]|nr:DJ-1/PfpI family protein [Ferrimonas aestuarii]
MMRQFRSLTLGFVMTSGMREADVVNLQTIFSAHPRNRCLFISETGEPVTGRSGLRLEANCRFSQTPKLDLLVVGEMTEQSLQNPQLQAFLSREVPRASKVIAVSNAVVALAMAGCLDEFLVTADTPSIHRLQQLGIKAIDCGQTIVDGKFYTSGPCTSAIESAFMVMNELRGSGLTKLLELNLEYHPKARFSDVSVPAQAPEELASIKPLKIGVTVSHFLYLPDVMGAIDVLSALPKVEFYFVGDAPTKVQAALGPEVFIDTPFEDCPPLDILLVGAAMPKQSMNVELLQFIKRQSQQAAAVIGVCAGSVLLGQVGLLKGKTAATNFHMRKLLPHFGAEISRGEVVADGKVYTAGPAIGSYEAALMAVAELFGQPVAAYLEQHRLEYRPHPLHGVGTPELAGKGLTNLSLVLCCGFNPLYRQAAKIGCRRLAQTTA